MKSINCIFINPFEKTITEVELNRNPNAKFPYLDAELNQLKSTEGLHITHFISDDGNGNGDTLYSDAEVLEHNLINIEKNPFFSFDNTLCIGYGLITYSKNGTTTDTPNISLDEVKQRVKFLKLVENI